MLNALLVIVAAGLGQTPSAPAPNVPPASVPGASSQVAGAARPALPAGVQAAIDAMAEAVTKGDKAAYMRGVVPSSGSPLADACFNKEQANWCDDWVKKPVEAYALSGATMSEVPAGISPPDDNRVLVALTTTWKLPEWRRERTLEKNVAFVREGPEKPWLYAGEIWVVVEKPADAASGFAGTRVKFPPSMPGEDNAAIAKVASIAASAMPSVRSHVDAFFGTKLTTVQEVKLYRTMKHLQHSIWLSYTDSLGGWNEPDEAIKVVVTASTGKRIRAYLAHEYGHVVTFTLGPKSTDAPWWALEGVAEMASESERVGAVEKRNAFVIEQYRKDNLAPWEAIAPFPLAKEHEKFGGHVYTQGEHMLAWLTERFGDASRTAFLTELAHGKSTDDAARAAFKQAWTDLDSAWRDSVAKLALEAKPAGNDGN